MRVAPGVPSDSATGAHSDVSSGRGRGTVPSSRTDADSGPVKTNTDAKPTSAPTREVPDYVRNYVERCRVARAEQCLPETIADPQVMHRIEKLVLPRAAS